MPIRWGRASRVPQGRNAAETAGRRVRQKVAPERAARRSHATLFPVALSRLETLRPIAASPPRREGAVDPYRINLSWLVRLRYGAIFGQLLVILAVDRAMGMALPLMPLGVILAVEVATNLLCSAWLRRATRVGEYHVGLLVALDVVLFTLLLYFTGGPTNPFSFLYLIHIALAALVLGSRWMWALVVLTLVCSGALFLRHAPLAMDSPPSGEHAAHDHAAHTAHMNHAAHAAHMNHAAHVGHADHGEHDYGMHLRGMWVALAVAAVFIVYFLQRATRELAQREAELARTAGFAGDAGRGGGSRACNATVHDCSRCPRARATAREGGRRRGLERRPADPRAGRALPVDPEPDGR
jgi:hypothetical protein